MSANGLDQVKFQRNINFTSITFYHGQNKQLPIQKQFTLLKALSLELKDTPH